jgi:Ca2+/H+ antiporter
MSLDSGATAIRLQTFCMLTFCRPTFCRPTFCPPTFCRPTFCPPTFCLHFVKDKDNVSVDELKYTSSICSIYYYTTFIWAQIWTYAYRMQIVVHDFAKNYAHM